MEMWNGAFRPHTGLDDSYEPLCLLRRNPSWRRWPKEPIATRAEIRQGDGILPLYLSNVCTNRCVYCGFNGRKIHITRITLTPEEAGTEGESCTRRMGFRTSASPLR